MPHIQDAFQRRQTPLDRVIGPSAIIELSRDCHDRNYKVNQNSKHKLTVGHVPSDHRLQRRPLPLFQQAGQRRHARAALAVV